MPPMKSVFGEDAAIIRDQEFQLLLLATSLPVLGSALVSPILDSLIGPFGTSPGNIGLMISFFTAPAIIGIPIAGALADRFGRKPVLVAALLLFGIGGTAIAFTTDYRVILGMRVLQGMGFSGIVPVITASIGDKYEGETEVTGQGLRVMVNGISGATIPLLAGALVVVAWQYPFLLYVVAFPVAAIVYLNFEEPTTETATEVTETDERAYYRILIGFSAQPRVFLMLIGRALPLIIWVGFLTYNSLVVVRILGGTPFQAGILVALGNLSFAIGASQVGRFALLLNGKFYMLIVANFCLGLGFIGFLFSPTVSLAFPWVLLTGIGFGMATPGYRSYLTELAPEYLRAGVVSLGGSGGRITSTVTPAAMGGFISLMTPVLGEAQAIQTAGVLAAVIATVLAIGCLVIATYTAPVNPERRTAVET